jgi:pimeloyl-ACP methyl ester carboxylesterase
MKSLGFVFVVLASCHHDGAIAPTAPAAAPTLAGTWAGTIELPGQPLQIQIAFDGDSRGTIDIPQQGATGLALSHVALAGDAVSFELAQVGAAFAGTLRGDAIAGTTTQSGQAFPFSMKRHPRDAYVPPPPPAEKLAAAIGAPLVGDWHGTSGDLPIAAKLGADAGVVIGTAAFGRSCQRATVTNLAFTAPHVHFEVGAAYFDGELAGATIAGTLHQGGTAKPFSLERTDRVRPPYAELEVAIESAHHVTLAGTLTVPDGVPRAPAVVLVTGSGPQDRDECVVGMRPFRQLADHLARHGIAVLRYDDRGTAGSTGDFAAATAADFTDDAEAAVRFLRARAEIDPRRVGVLGHSEGGLIAPMLAARTRDVAFIVLWAGPGLPLVDVVLQQAADILRAEGTQPATIDEQLDHERRAFAALRVAKTDAELHAALHAIVADDAWVDAKQKEIGSAWMRWYLDYDPAATLRKVRCPVLAINGGLDMQVAPGANLAAIRRALEAGHHRDFEIVELPGLNHLFQPTKTGAPSEYRTNPPVLDAAVLDATTRWLAKHVQ